MRTTVYLVLYLLVPQLHLLVGKGGELIGDCWQAVQGEGGEHLTNMFTNLWRKIGQFQLFLKLTVITHPV